MSVKLHWASARAMAFMLLLGATVASSHAAPFAYITNQGSHDVSVIDLLIDSVVSTVPVGRGQRTVV